METRRLYRSEQDRMLAGVCGGVGAYLDIDPTVVRVVFVVLGLLSGIGVVLYLVMWVVVPSESRVGAPPPDVAREGVADIRDRARQGVEEARQAVQRLRGHEPGEPGEPGEPFEPVEPVEPPSEPPGGPGQPAGGDAEPPDRPERRDGA